MISPQIITIWQNLYRKIWTGKIGPNPTPPPPPPRKKYIFGDWNKYDHAHVEGRVKKSDLLAFITPSSILSASQILTYFPIAQINTNEAILLKMKAIQRQFNSGIVRA